MKKLIFVGLFFGSLLFSWQGFQAGRLPNHLSPYHSKGWFERLQKRNSAAAVKPVVHNHSGRYQFIRRVHALLKERRWTPERNGPGQIPLSQHSRIVELFRTVSNSPSTTGQKHLARALLVFDPTLEPFLTKRLHRRLEIISKLPIGPIRKLNKVIEAVELAVDQYNQPIDIDFLPKNFLKNYLALKDWLAETNSHLHKIPVYQRNSIRFSFNGTFQQVHFSSNQIDPRLLAVVFLADVDQSM